LQQFLLSAQPVLLCESINVTTLCPIPLCKLLDLFTGRHDRSWGRCNLILLDCGLAWFRGCFCFCDCICHVYLLKKVGFAANMRGIIYRIQKLELESE